MKKRKGIKTVEPVGVESEEQPKTKKDVIELIKEQQAAADADKEEVAEPAESKATKTTRKRKPVAKTEEDTPKGDAKPEVSPKAEEPAQTTTPETTKRGWSLIRYRK